MEDNNICTTGNVKDGLHPCDKSPSSYSSTYPPAQLTVVFPWLASYSSAARYIWSNSSKLEGAWDGTGNQYVIDDNEVIG